MTLQYENTLRQLIIDVLGDEDKSDYNISKEISEKWFAKRTNAKNKNDGFLFEKRIIFYADFEDLALVIEENWKEFLPILFDKKRFQVFFKEVGQFRKTINSGNNLIQSQENLLSGIVMDLKNAITIYNNKENLVDDYFISIKKISDNLGTSWSKSDTTNKKKPVLKVGDDYELLVEANDPKDRKIEYQIAHFAGKLKIKQDSNRFNFKIDKEFIGQNTMLIVKAFTADADYVNESILKIHLTVLPE
ncbi:hypothetical protein KO506_04500 [Polaribacter vadi]|uniref:hypothetical protein n=1 Tax=Polaribacter TaxID=52959 RepID=UPI001C08184E|nr:MULTISPECIES: hypothetical protein [Polaribacter]MBU3010647.1 hypothetical protein [Polaribacter vadi]MDO6740458.1 hypothetical protein [Polaribacter sp. 1_MG-2023]